MTWSLVATSLFLGLAVFTHCQEEEVQDPCSPNPCGENTLCFTNGGIIGCNCVPGTAIPEGGDPFDGCFPPSGISPQSVSSVATTDTLEQVVQVESEAIGEDEDQEPRSLEVAKPGKEEVLATQEKEEQEEEEEGDQGETRLQAGRRPGHLAPRRPSATSRPNTVYAEVDTKELFPDECLVHEDCEDTDFCHPTELKCHDACTLAVCGEAAVCISKLHRPVCACPDGFEGNPYDTCTKSASRVGMKFRRKRWVIGARNDE